jgi:CRISPR-associated endonuclease Csn1
MRLVGEPERIKPLVAALSAWLDQVEQFKTTPAKLFEAGKLPRHPRRGEGADAATGPAIRALKVRRKRQRSGITIHRGSAEAHVDLDSMIRLDVFERDARYYLVPVYAYQLSLLDAPPRHAIVADKDEPEWELLDESFSFRFSLYPGSWIEAVDRKGKLTEGYYRTSDRSVGSIKLSPHDDHRNNAQLQVSPKTLKSFRKFNVDRFGHRAEIVREPRLWHGAASS